MRGLCCSAYMSNGLLGRRRASRGVNAGAQKTTCESKTISHADLMMTAPIHNRTPVARPSVSLVGDGLLSLVADGVLFLIISILGFYPSPRPDEGDQIHGQLSLVLHDKILTSA